MIKTLLIGIFLVATIHLTAGVGGDYAGWVEVYTYLVGLGALADDYECEQISDVTINNNWGPGVPAGITLNGHYVRFYCAWENSHQGNPTRGYITYCTGALGYFSPYNATSLTGSFYIENLYFVQTANVAASLMRPKSHGLLPRPDIHVYVNNVLIKGAAAGATAVNGLVFDNSYVNYHVDNVKIWGCAYGFFTTYSGTNLFDRVRIVENVTVWGCTQYSYSLGGLPEVIYMRNCYGCAATTRDWNGGHGVGVTILDNCADSDNSIALSLNATENNCFANINEATEILSIDDTNVNFLRIDPSSDLYGVGTLSINNTESIEHYPRPNVFGLVSIGASEPNVDIDFIGVPLEILLNGTVDFTSIINEAIIASYAWDLDDSQTAVIENPSEIYEIAGYKTISLTVVDSLGNSYVVTKVDYILVHSNSIRSDKGLIFCGINSRRAVLLGSIADSVLSLEGLGIIEFLESGTLDDTIV